MELLRRQLAEAIAAATPLDVDSIQANLSVPPDPALGHLAFPCFALAKTFRKAPPVIAGELTASVTAPEGTELRAAGGYLNLVLRPERLARATIVPALEAPGTWGRTKTGAGRTAVIDYSSPNIGKELVYHHIRSTVLGAALCRLYDAAGWNTVAVNHLGDWGTQFGKLILMYLRHHGGDRDAALSGMPEVTLEMLNALYTGFKSAAAQEPALEDEARSWFRRLEEGDVFARTLWARFVEVTRDELDRLYVKLDARFDHYLGESFYEDKLQPVLDRLGEKGLLEVSEGAQVVALEGMPPCLIRKQDGATLYATRDLAAAFYRQERFGFDRCLYVVDAGQSLHFRQVFAVLEKLGHPASGRCRHIPFGLVLGKDDQGKWSKVSTRSGGGSLLREVLDTATGRIDALMAERNPDLPDRATTAEAIGVGAIVFNELRNKRMMDIKFDWDAILSFEGDTGPYIQYAYVRLCGILRKAGALPDLATARLELLAEPEAQRLMQLVGALPERLDAAVESDEPSVVAQYCLDLAEAFHHFYQHHRVLEHEASPERILLVEATRIALGNAMRLLGLKPIERM